ncbi:MAG: RIP metalloprotease RseP [Bacteroidales bacterium]
MDVLMKVIQLIVSLSILVVIHEFGHFMFAKLFKCRVEKFYLFFDPWFSLFKKKIGETEYGVGWLPLGGYVKISGMIDESMDKEQMKEEPKAWEFRSKPAYQRLLIMIGGVLMNIIGACIIYVGISYCYGETFLLNENAKYGIVASEPAKSAGFMNGDKVVSIDGKAPYKFSDISSMIVLDHAKEVVVDRQGQIDTIVLSDDFIAEVVTLKSPLFSFRQKMDFSIDGFADKSPAQDAGVQKGDVFVGFGEERIMYYDEFQAYLKGHAGQTVAFAVSRNGENKTINVPLTDDGMLGIKMKFQNLDDLELTTLKYSFLQSIPNGFKLAGEKLSSYVKSIGLLFKPKTNALGGLGGFGSLAGMFPSSWNWEVFWNMTAFLSVILAVMNLLPIPGLDGGHVMFVLYEMVTGRKPSDKFMEYAITAGFIFLIALLLFANGNDIYRAITGK